MHFEMLFPRSELQDIIKCYWLIENDDTTKNIQKIIPDGYPELIFHYRDSYKANIQGFWEDQSLNILAGQITHFFHLENTGKSGMVAIKFQPWAVHDLFGFQMNTLKNKAIGLSANEIELFKDLKKAALSSLTFEKKVLNIEKLMLAKPFNLNPNFHIVKKMIQANGDISLSDCLQNSGVSERQLERYFQSSIGVTPKRYLRILRFANIFKLVEENHQNWSEISYTGGYYDQSHFIKNFKEFTGEDPSKYGFNEKTMANFLLV